MRFLKITLAYDGTDYIGWQIQPNGRSIQQTLETALLKITGEKIRAVASGRTDAGVHALAQVVSLQTESRLEAQEFCRALDANTPPDIAVLSVSEAPKGFHAIRDAVSKRYRYIIHDGPMRDVFTRLHAWHIPRRLDVEAMHCAARSIRGKHDFTSFEAAGSERATSVRTISDIFVRRSGDGESGRVESGRVIVEIEADGFLYNMVRNIIGTLVEVGYGKQSVDWPASVLAAKNRKIAGATAPPHGLFLVRVEYNR